MEKIDLGASTHTAELILEGDYNDQELNSTTKLLVSQIQKKTELDSIPGIINEMEWKEKIQNWKESTSTSPSGFQLTHSKSLLAKHNLKEDSPEGITLEHQQATLIKWQVELLNAAIINKHSYNRWQTVVTIMILKTPGDTRIHRLRVIHLYEQDYNLLLAIKWRALIQTANKKGIINPGQYGGIPGSSSVTPTIIEELQYEVTRASKQPLVHLDYDATACYDRIVMNLAGLIARGFGQHRSIVFINGNTLQQAQYRLKTAFNVSDTFFKHNNVFPIFGSGQGAGNMSGIWGCISSVTFDCYQQKSAWSNFFIARQQS